KFYIKNERTPARGTRPSPGAPGGERAPPVRAFGHSSMPASGAVMSLIFRSRRATFGAIASIAALVVLAGYTAVTTGRAGAASTLLPQGNPAPASSVEGAGTPASAAVDGNAGTRWSSVFTDPQWLQVDLGGTATVDRVVLSWEAAYATAYQIQVS